MTEAPRFAVVGHPNKGKSSIVATMSCDDSVRIGADPGTTVESRNYPMRVDGDVLYTLIDTPGFQRARRALAWMAERGTTAAERPGIVAAFVEAHRNGDDFPDECRLLSPIIEGAGILYVVDGSVPYGPEYEAEMQILRWAGRPSMGLINPIGEADHTESWRSALRQYFNVVRVFDALHSDFYKRIELLKAFGELQESWRAPLERAVAALRDDRTRKRRQAAAYVANALADMLTLRAEVRLGEEESAASRSDALMERFKTSLRRIERKARERVEEVYDQHALDRREEELPLLDGDLFSEETWRLFGLTRMQLLGLGAVGGGAVGGALDLATGGASLFTGAVIGTVAGAAGSYAAQRSLARVKVMVLPLAGRHLVVEPVSNPNFPHVAYGRARLHHDLAAKRTHAERGPMAIDEAAQHRLRELTAAERRELEDCFAKIRKGRSPIGQRERLEEVIARHFAEDDAAEG